MLTIRHTHADGTLVEGTRRGDGTQPALKACGFRWSRDLAAWYLPRRRDRLARRPVIDQLAEQLRTAGNTVEIEIDDTPRPTGQVEADRATRASARAARLARRAERAQAASDTHAEKARTIAGPIPLRQPILVDHYSASRHRRDLDRAAWEAHQAAREAERRAELAASEHDSRHEPHTVARRIDHLTTELRGLERAHARRPSGDETLAAALARTRDQLAYWQQIRDDQLVSGQIVDYGPHNIRAGDLIQYRQTWYLVERANRKTVSIPSRVGGNWTDRIPYHQISDHRAATGRASLEAAHAAAPNQAPTDAGAAAEVVESRPAPGGRAERRVPPGIAPTTPDRRYSPRRVGDVVRRLGRQKRARTGPHRLGKNGSATTLAAGRVRP